VVPRQRSARPLPGFLVRIRRGISVDDAEATPEKQLGRENCFPIGVHYRKDQFTVDTIASTLLSRSNKAEEMTCPGT
jgi:hypothetical protein